MIFVIELPLLILMLPANIKGIFVMIILYAVLCSYVTYMKSDMKVYREEPKMTHFTIFFIINVLLVTQFIRRWQFSSKLGYIAEKIGLNNTLLLVIAGTICGIVGTYSLKINWDYFISFVKNRKNPRGCVLVNTLFKWINHQYDKVMIFTLVTAVICISIFFACYFLQTLLFANYPAEYRDGAIFKLVDDLASGYNPYTINTLYQTEPPVVVDSGFFHIFPSVLMQKFFGVPASLALYITNGIYIILIIFVSKNIFRNIAFSYQVKDKCLKVEMLCIIAWLLTFLQRNTILVTRPDIFCCLLLLIIIDLYTRPVFKVKFIYISAFLCVIIAFAKIHYAMIVVSILVYFIYRRDKFPTFVYCVQFALAGICFTILVFIVTERLFPTYLSEWIPRIIEMFSQNASFEKESIAFLNGKFKRLALKLFPALIIIAYGYIKYILNVNKKQPFVEGSKIFLSINIIINLLALLYVGRHNGADLWYFFIMLVPSIVFLTADIIVHTKAEKSQYALACIIILVGCWLNMVPIIQSTAETPARANTFKKAYSLLQEYDKSEMYLSPVLSNYCIESDVYNYNYGDGFYFVDTMAAENLYEIFPLIKTILPYTKDIYYQHEEYEHNILVKMQNKDYSVIVLDEVDSIPYIVRERFLEELDENYQIVEEIMIQYQTGETKLSYWVPQN